MPVPARRAFSAAYCLSSPTTARRAPCRTASSASASTLLLPVSATTSNMSGLRPIRSSVLLPTEPVAPSTLTRLRCGARVCSAVRCRLGRRTGARLRHAGHYLRHQPEQQRARRRMHVDRHADQACGRCRRDQAIDAIHDAAVARDQRGCCPWLRSGASDADSARSPVCAMKPSTAAVARQPQRRHPGHHEPEPGADDGAREHRADQAGPGLVRGDARPQLGPAQQTPAEEGRRIRGNDRPRSGTPPPAARRRRRSAARSGRPPASRRRRRRGPRRRCCARGSARMARMAPIGRAPAGRARRSRTPPARRPRTPRRGARPARCRRRGHARGAPTPSSAAAPR